MFKNQKVCLTQLRRKPATMVLLAAILLNSGKTSATVSEIIVKGYISQSDWVESLIGLFFALIFVATRFRFCKKNPSQSLRSEHQTSASYSESKKDEMIDTTVANRMRFAIIDDDIFIRDSWELFMQEFNILTFDSPETFLLASDRSSSFLASFDAIIVDYDFGVKSNMSGTELAQILRRKTAIPIILSTDMDPKDISEIERFDLHLDKNALDWHSLQKLLPAMIS
jgi:hypothetical protein